MIALFVHQNFPAQYLHLVHRLASRKEWRVYFITQCTENEIPGVRKVVYKPALPAVPGCHPYIATFDSAVRTGIAVRDICRTLKSGGVVPDIVVGHSGWGETLFVKEVFPDAPLLSYFEFFYHTSGADVGFDPEFAPGADDDHVRLQIRNTVNHLSFAGSDWGHTATAWQRSLFPPPMQARITSLHEGVDTRQVKPDARAWLKLARENVVLTRKDEVVTYVSRNLEPYRGFHVFMRALAELLRRRPRAHALIIGGDEYSYGGPPPHGGSYREMLLSELGDSLDLERVHFLGRVAYRTYLNVLQVSAVHVHLTYPFVLSWSFIEAMSAGCAMVSSATHPVLEILRDRENGLLVDFFSTGQICDKVDEILDHPDRMQSIRDGARATAVGGFDTSRVTLPRWETLLNGLIAGEFPKEQPPDPGPATERAHGDFRRAGRN
jgi:glycosyltransferase involved in cell wall biosynthesis